MYLRITGSLQVSRCACTTHHARKEVCDSGSRILLPNNAASHDLDDGIAIETERPERGVHFVRRDGRLELQGAAASAPHLSRHALDQHARQNVVIGGEILHGDRPTDDFYSRLNASDSARIMQPQMNGYHCGHRTPTPLDKHKRKQ